jgi:transcription-repair coupling factor (superfamily II helicase)
MLYRKVASSRRDEEIDAILDEAADRYGPLPTSLLNLADYGRIRIMADQLGIESLDREGRTVVLKFGARTKLDPARLVTMVRRRNDLTLLPPSGLKLSLDGGSKAGAAGAQAMAVAPSRPAGGPSRPGGAPAPGRGMSDARRKRPEIAPSWWTARAREGEVRPGFTKAEILQARPDDPRAPGGLFERVGGLLSEILTD